MNRPHWKGRAEALKSWLESQGFRVVYSHDDAGVFTFIHSRLPAKIEMKPEPPPKPWWMWRTIKDLVGGRRRVKAGGKED